MMKKILDIVFFFLLLTMIHPVSAQKVTEKVLKWNENAEYSQAIREAKLYLKAHPDDEDMQFLLAKTYSLSSRDFQAIEGLKSILKQYPAYHEARVILCQIYLKKHEYGLAYQLIQQGLKRYPNHAQFLSLRSQILLDIYLGPPYLPLIKMYDKGLKQIAIQKAQNYLKVFPQDADVALILAKLYVKHGQYHKARDLLLNHIYLYPSYSELYLSLINIDIHLHHLKEGIMLVHLGLIFSPWDALLHKKKNDLVFLMQKRKSSKPQKSPNQYVEVERAHVPEPKSYLNEIAIYQQNYYITDVRKVWDYTSVYYGRQTQLGKLYGKINYASRLKRQAAQYEIEFFPKLNRFLYLDLDASVANQPVLFPNYSYAAELFVVFPHLFNSSYGAQMNKIDNRHQYSRFTTSISKDIHLSNLTFRPYFYLPNAGARSILYTLNYRYTFLEPYGYMGFVVGAGTTPDLANLETIDFLVLKNKILSPYINFALFQDRLILNMSLLYQNQIFPNERVRDWLGGVLGGTWRF
jgi:YaiO family outer membrane protein